MELTSSESYFAIGEKMSITGDSRSLFLSQPSKSSSKVGRDVLCYCARCKMNLTHTIITVGPNNVPARVHCNTCKSEKQYRAPKPESLLRKESQNMVKADDEQDLDLDAGAKHLHVHDEYATKKKAKPKSKPKKKDEQEFKPATKSSSLPLSLQEANPEDISQFEARMLSQKNNLASAKEYHTSVRFKSGELLKHKSFGIGFVIAESGLNKIEVLFSVGRKLLVNGGEKS